MRKFFKMGLAICMVLVLLCSLAACSGGGSGSGSDSGGVGDGFSNANPTVKKDDNDNADEKYEYDVDGNKISCMVNVNDYLSEEDGKKYFDFARLVEDYGFKKDDLGPAADKRANGQDWRIVLSRGGQTELYGDTRTCCSGLVLIVNDDLSSHVDQTVPEKAEYLILGESKYVVSYDFVILCAYVVSNNIPDIHFPSILSTCIEQYPDGLGCAIS